MEAIRISIKTVLPRISDSILDKIIEKLETDGVEEPSDLEYVTASDLEGLHVLKPIETRKLLKSWANKSEVPLMTAVTEDKQPAPSTSKDASAGLVHLLVQPSCSNQEPVTLDVTYTDPSWPHKFIIPWNYLPVHVFRALNKGERLVGKDRKSLIHLLVDAVRKICKNPSKSQLKIIAQKVYEHHPNAITDQLNGSVIGCGYDTFLKQVVNRCENQNRGNYNPFKRTLPAEIENLPNGSVEEGKRGGSQKDSYGCVSWQPHIEDLEELQELKQQLGQLDPASDKIEEFLRRTYPLQRREINSGKPLSELLLEWPFLFTECAILAHFEQLTGCNIKENLKTSFQEKASRILKFGERGHHSGKMVTRCYQILQDLATAKKETNDEQPMLLAVVQLLMANLEEKEQALFHVVDENAVSSEVDLNGCPATPLIVACGDSILLTRRFMLAVDGMIVLPRITSVLSAISLLFAVFYCFNIEYPENAAGTLEFIQRCFVGINPGKGTKASRGKKKKTSAMNPKVMAFIKTLADFEWAQTGETFS